MVSISVELALWARIEGLTRMAGIWKHEVKGRTVSVRVEPFAKLPRWAGTQVAAEAERLADFLGGRVELTLRGL